MGVGFRRLDAVMEPGSQKRLEKASRREEQSRKQNEETEPKNATE